MFEKGWVAANDGNITIRLDPRTLEKLRQEAHQRGIGPTTLARMWILERLQETGEH